MGRGEGWIEDLETLDSRQFTIALRGLADSLSYGIDKSPFVGSGVEFVQSRPYQDGDSVRSIDWRVTARTGRYHVKEYESPKSMPCYLLVDTSASMTVSSQKRSKYHAAVYLAGGLALASLDRVSPVGLVGVGGRALRVQPSLSQARVMQWMLTLRKYRFDEHTNLAMRITELSPSLTSRAFFIVISDLHDRDAIPALKRLVQRHDLIVLQLEDPAEVGLRGAGFFRAREAETGREFVTHGRRRWVDPAWAERDFKRAGIDHLRIRTDQPFVHSLRSLFASRGWIGKGGR